MPPKIKITKQAIIDTALEVVRKQGMVGLNARNIAAAFGCSTQPIFSNFRSMEDLKLATVEAANGLYEKFIQAEMEKGEYPPYKAVGMAYIRFAKEEKELFRLLFMRDRSTEKTDDGGEKVRPFTALVQKNTGVSEDDALLMHLEMWMCVHGIATTMITDYQEWSWDLVSRMLTDCYQGLIKRYKDKE